MVDVSKVDIDRCATDIDGTKFIKKIIRKTPTVTGVIKIDRPDEQYVVFTVNDKTVCKVTPLELAGIIDSLYIQSVSIPTH